ncbi:Basic proline-rich protein precursor [Hyalangium minutum]|uniref:Basic proline-rich protein n=1 Tax=Hyalangium minutum TaxID=394096 RepID=A0A085WJP8_9BACT|nr:Basic proline-rich protein precursor [Hyalangium minutum]
MPTQRQQALPAPRVPHLHRAVIRPGHHSLPVRTPPARIHKARVPAQRQQALPAPCVPHLHRAVIRPGHHSLPVRTPPARSHTARVPAQRQQALSAPRVPHLHRAVIRPGHHSLPVRTPPARSHKARVPAQRQQALPAPRVPHLHRAVIRPGHHSLPVRTPLARIHKARVPAQRQQALSAPRVPHLHRAVRRPGHHSLPVRTPPARSHKARVPAQRQQALPAPRVPHLHRAVIRPGHHSLPVRTPPARSHKARVSLQDHQPRALSPRMTRALVDQRSLVLPILRQSGPSSAHSDPLATLELSTLEVRLHQRASFPPEPAEVAPLGADTRRAHAQEHRLPGLHACELSIPKLHVLEPRTVEPRAREVGSTKVERLRGATALEPPALQVRSRQLHPCRRGRRVPLLERAHPVREGQPGGAQRVSPQNGLHGAQGLLGVSLPLHELPEEVHRLPGHLLQRPPLQLAFLQGALEVGGQEVLLQGGMREAEVPLLIGRPQDKGRRAQVLLQYRTLLGGIRCGNRRVRQQVLVKPCLQPIHCPLLAALSPERGGELLHQLALMVLSQLVLPVVPVDP